MFYNKTGKWTYSHFMMLMWSSSLIHQLVRQSFEYFIVCFTLKEHEKLTSTISFIIQVAKAKTTQWVVASYMKLNDFNSQYRNQKVCRFLIIMLTMGFDSEFVFMLNLFTLLMSSTSRTKVVVIFGCTEELINMHAGKKDYRTNRELGFHFPIGKLFLFLCQIYQLSTFKYLS